MKPIMYMQDVHCVLLLCIFRYGQMTAGSYCYIGPQGIVHGTMVCEILKNHNTLLIISITVNIACRV